MTLLDAAGTIGPRSAPTPAAQAALSSLAAHPEEILCSPASGYPAQCIDGRPWKGSHLSHPRSAGGSLSTWVVDFLLTGVFAPSDVTEQQQLSDVLLAWLDTTCATLAEAGLPVSGHRDDHAHAPKAGCGAADALGPVLALLGSHPAGIDSLLEEWGINPADLPDVVFARAREAAASVPSGADLLAVLEKHSQHPLPTLTGPHLEAAIIANARAGSTLRPGSGPTPDDQAFDVDLWALPRIADLLLLAAARSGHLLAATDTQITATAAAFNAAALLVLCNSNMPSLVLRDE